MPTQETHQQVFLQALQDRQSIAIYLTNGTQLTGTLKAFDAHCLILTK